MIPASAKLFCAVNWLQNLPMQVPARASRAGKWVLALSLIVLAFCPGRAVAGPYLPVYIGDNHAGSFYWLAETLNWNESYDLILFDRHSDATEVINSDFIRKVLEKNRRLNYENEYYRRWKEKGIIQCFNWLEPLMPYPVRRVVWVQDNKLTSQGIEKHKEQVKRTINGHQAAVPRTSGDLSSHFIVTDFQSQRERSDFSGPAVVSIDLDYLTDTPRERAEEEFQNIIDYALSIPTLEALTIAISRPYLKSDEQADFLLSIALDSISRVMNARIRFEPFADNGPDRSEMARMIQISKGRVPYFNIELASSRLAGIIMQNPSRFIVTGSRERWKNLIERWARDFERPALLLKANGPVHEDNSCYLVRSGVPFEVVLDHGNHDADDITWYEIEPMDRSYNIIGTDTYGFAKGAPRYIVFRPVLLNSLKDLRVVSSDQLNGLFDRRTGWGTVRLFAEIRDGRETIRTPWMCISRYLNEGYTGRLTEIFNLPYILGSGVFSFRDMSGADARYGADCLNFIIYGRRRQGYLIPYLNLNNFRQHLEKIDDVQLFKDGIAHNRRGAVPIDQDQIHEGLLLHFGTHVAALYRDRSPFHVLDSEDLVMHQLEDFPEIIELGKLRQADKPFMLMKFKPRSSFAFDAENDTDEGILSGRITP